MTTTRPASMPAKVARAARSAAGDGEGKLASSAWTATRNPALRQAGDDLAIVDVAAGRRLDVAGNDEVDACRAARHQRFTAPS